MLNSTQLRQVVTEARPIIERMLNDATALAGLRDVVAAAGGDWSQLKALLKAQIQDEEAGEDKRVRKVLEKAEYATAYADMLGIGGNLNDGNISDEAADQMRQWARDRIASGVDIPEHDADGVIIEPDAAMRPQTVPLVGPVNVSAGQASVESPASIEVAA